MFGKPVLELSIAFEDECKRLTHNVLNLVCTQELGIPLGGLSE